MLKASATLTYVCSLISEASLSAVMFPSTTLSLSEQHCRYSGKVHHSTVTSFYSTIYLTCSNSSFSFHWPSRLSREVIISDKKFGIFVVLTYLYNFSVLQPVFSPSLHFLQTDSSNEWFLPQASCKPINKSRVINFGDRRHPHNPQLTFSILE